MATFVLDTFSSGAAGADLAARTGETGATWTRHPAAAVSGGQIVLTSGGRARSNNANQVVYYASGTPATADYDVQCDVVAVTTPSSAPFTGIVARCDPVNDTMYALSYGAAGWYLGKRVTGAYTQLGYYAQPLAAGTTYAVKLSLRGSALTAFVDGTPIITATDGAIAAAGRVGLFGALAMTDTTGLHWDNVSAADPVPQSTIAVGDANWFFSPYNWLVSGAQGSAYAQTNAPGAYCKLAFTGTAGATLLVDTGALARASVAATNYPRLRYSIDGGPFVDVQLAAGANVPLGALSAAATHTLELHVLATDGGTDRWTAPVNIVRIGGLQVDAGATTAPYAGLKARRALAFGDSITEGAGMLATGGAPAANDATQSYMRAVLLGVGCEYGLVAYQGQGWRWGGGGNVPMFFVPGNDAASAWNKLWSGQGRLAGGLFAPPPDYILLCMGTNDGGNGVSDAAVTQSVSGFIPAARAAAPATTPIVIVIPFGGYKRAAIMAGVAAAADAYTFVCDCGGTSGANNGLPGLSAYGAATQQSVDGTHPRPFVHAQLAGQVARLMQQALDATTHGPGGGPVVWRRARMY